MDAPFLKANMCFLHGLMRASEGLLYSAISHSTGDLRSWFERHLEQERGHLQMLAQDICALGITRVLSFPAAAQLAGAQYYLIEHENPALLLGYMAALEGSAPPIAQVDALEKQFGQLRCTRHHAEHDPGHVEEIRGEIRKLAAPLRQRVEENETWTLRDLRDRIVPMIQHASNFFR